MANRYWISGTGAWDNSTTTHWSATSGGASGASVPISTDDVFFDGSSGGGTVTPNYNMTVASIAMGDFTGTLDFSANNNSPTMGRFEGSSTGNGVRTLNMGSGTWTITSDFFGFGGYGTSNLTFNANTSTIKFTNTDSVGAKQFLGGGLTYYNLWFARGTSTTGNVINSSNTFNELKDTGTVAHSLLFNAGTTQTIKTWTVSGTAGNLITITTDTAATHTLQKTATSPATITADYTDISYSNAVDIYGGTWNATNSTDGGNNSGWIFGSIAPTVTTQPATIITATTALGNGTVTSMGSSGFSERGIVWAITTAPTTLDNKIAVIGALGVFSALMTGLTTGTLYYARAYAINAYGTAYGNEVTFMTPLFSNDSKPSSTMINQSKP